MRFFKLIIKLLIFSSIIIFSSSFSNSYQVVGQEDSSSVNPEFIELKNKWIDSVFNSLSLDEKITQSIGIAVYPTLGAKHHQNIAKLIKKYKPGVIMFSKGTPTQQARLTNYYQSISKTPMLVAMDAEWGLAMRLDSVTQYPRQMLLGAIQNDKLIFDFGIEVARQCKRLGVNVNFAPVVDINNNPLNPVIGSRSFGEQRWNVANKGFAYMFGMQHNKIIATAKHFPGHGDTDSDSHHTVPVIKHSYSRLDSIELYPFKELINNGLSGVMIAHLHVPALDSANHIVSSLSKKIVSGLLKKKLNYKGLIFTDALGMKATESYGTYAQVAVQAYLSGADIMLMPKDIPGLIKGLKDALKKGLITEYEINKRSYKILQAKSWVGLDKYKAIETKNLISDLNSDKAKYLRRKLIEKAITLVKNKDFVIPFKNIDSIRIASVSIGYDKRTEFQKTLSLYDNVEHFTINKLASSDEFNTLIGKLTKFDYVIIGFHRVNYRPPLYGLTPQSIKFAHELTKYTKVIIDIFASPYTLKKFDRNKFSAIIMSYENSKLSQNLSAQLLYGGIKAAGKLPVSAGNQYPARTGVVDEKIRLKYAIPKELNIDELKLGQIDSIVYDAIKQRAMPGCQILAIKDGMVFYNKSFGYHTYAKKRKVTNDDIYDLASLTKITATMPAIMKLTEEGKIDINSKLSKYIAGVDTSNKKNIRIKQVLAHQARLRAWIPFYIKTFDKNAKTRYKLNPQIYKNKKDSIYCLHVADNIYMRKSYVDTMYKQILQSPLRHRKGYRYSDLGFYLFYKMISNTIDEEFPDYLEHKFYAPLGSNTLCYNPLDKFPRERIVPTELDLKLRKELVQGYVHDYGAAMMGGVSGHAGLFSNANDLGKLMQMYLQKGEYGGERFFNNKTIELFTSKAYKGTSNRRALGFDRPGRRHRSPVVRYASPNSFGHSGFTGTIAWVDPKENFVYIFLSNRVYPDAENKKLLELNVRTKVQAVFYKAFRDAKTSPQLQSGAI